MKIKINRQIHWAIGALVLGTAMAGYSAMSAQSDTGITELSPLAMPRGITIQPTGIAQGYSMNKESATKLPRAKIVYADANGMTLYYNDTDSLGKSGCIDECAKTWQPATVSANATPVTDWSVVVREDGMQQWAYKNKPLYTYNQDTDIGSVGGNSPRRFGRGPGVGLRGSTSASIPKDKPMPEGWYAAIIYPVTDAVLPGSIQIHEVEDAMALVLVEEKTGKSLYAFNGDANKAMKACATAACRNRWSPLVAPRITFPRGDFGVDVRDDGITQRTYKGRALFTYSGDLVFRDAFGVGVDESWQLAAYRRYYVPPNVTTQNHPKLGKLLATADGKTLYRRNSHIFQSGSGHSLRRGDPIRPAVGRDLGTNPRCTVECDKWHPFLAPADAESWGDWSVANRTDGSKQWVQRGYALWTYDGDEAPGETNGNDSYQFVIGHDKKKAVDIGTPVEGPWALLWIAASP